MEDDISILPDCVEDSSVNSFENSAGLVPIISLGSSDVPASTHALLKAYQDLRNRYNEMQQQNKALRRKTARVVSGQRMASENGFFSGGNGTPFDSREQGAAAMADSVLDDQVKQGLINHLQLQLKQTETKYSIRTSELDNIRRQFEEFRSKHSRCFQEKDFLVTQIRNIDSERKKLIETVEKLKVNIENQMTCKNCKQSTSRKKNEEVGPASFPGFQKGVCLVRLDEFECLQEQIIISEKSMDTLKSLLQKQNRTILALIEGQSHSDKWGAEVATGVGPMPDLIHSPDNYGVTGSASMEIVNPDRVVQKGGQGDQRSRLERQDPVSDDVDSITDEYPHFMFIKPHDQFVSATEEYGDVKLPKVLPSNYKPISSESWVKHKLKSQHNVEHLSARLRTSSLETSFKDANSADLLRFNKDSGLTSNIKRKEAQDAVERIVSAINRTSSTPQPHSHLLRVSKEPVTRTSSSPVQFNSSEVTNNPQTSLSEIKSPTILDPVHTASVTQLVLPKEPIPGFLTRDVRDLTAGSQNMSSALHTSNVNQAGVRDLTPGSQNMSSALHTSNVNQAGVQDLTPGSQNMSSGFHTSNVNQAGVRDLTPGSQNMSSALHTSNVNQAGVRDLTPGSQNMSSALHTSNVDEAGAPMPTLADTLHVPLPQPSGINQRAINTNSQPSDSQRVCPICTRAFSHLTMTEFQNHVFDCYDNTDSGEIERPEASSDNLQMNRRCPLCDVQFEYAIPQDIFERHVQEHFDETPLNNDDFTVLNP